MRHIVLGFDWAFKKQNMENIEMPYLVEHPTLDRHVQVGLDVRIVKPFVVFVDASPLALRDGGISKPVLDGRASPRNVDQPHRDLLGLSKPVEQRLAEIYTPEKHTAQGVGRRFGGGWF